MTTDELTMRLCIVVIFLGGLLMLLIVR